MARGPVKSAVKIPAMRSVRGLLIAVMAALALSACAAPRPLVRESEGAVAVPAAKKQLAAAIQIDLPSMSSRLSSPLPGAGEMESFANASLARADINDVLQPVMAETVPTVENGLWKLAPDGRMEMTWRIKEGARWHDGTPLTTDDLLFTSKVGQDKEVSFVGSTAVYAYLDTIEALDSRTALVKWKQPYVAADRGIISTTTPLPRHILEEAYVSNKPGLVNLPYWTTEFVGTGPYRLREWVGASHALLEANADYVLGRPKIDEISVRFIPDPNTMAANILAGAVEIPVGNRTLSYEQTVEVLGRWPDGTMDPLIGESWFVAKPQFLNTDPPIVAELQFRRALIHAVDRQQLADSFQGGLGPVAYSIMQPRPRYEHISARQLRYEFDVRKAAQLFESLGLTRGTDGMLRDSSNKLVGEMKVMTTGQNDLGVKTAHAVVDYWRQAGVDARVVVSSTQQERDLVYRATYPAMEIIQYRTGIDRLLSYLSSNAATPANNYNGERSHYSNPAYDALVGKYNLSIDEKARMDVVGQMADIIQDQLVAMGFYYQVAPYIHTKRLKNFKPLEWWNSHQWDLAQ